MLARIAAALIAVGACTSAPPVPVIPSPTVTVGPTATASAQPTVPADTFSPEPTRAGHPASGIEAFALGPLVGDHAFVIAGPQESGSAPTGPTTSELWAVPLSGGQPRLAARFVGGAPAQTGVGTAAGRTENVLARQWSPDGRSVLLSVATPRSGSGWRLSLVILDLETGRHRMVGSDDGDHDVAGAWSPDGRRIAYVRRPDALATGMFDDGLWVMNADGSAPRRVEPHGFGSFTKVFDWAPDSRRVTFAHSFEEAPLQWVDVDGGAGGRTEKFIVYPPVVNHSWRSGTPGHAVAFAEHPRQSRMFVAVADDLGSLARILVKDEIDVFLNNVRWHPSRDELLYVRSVQELYVVGLNGQPRRIPTAAERLRHVEWAPTGEEIVYIESRQPRVFDGVALHVMRADGTSDRVLLTPREGMSFSDLAVRRY